MKKLLLSLIAVIIISVTTVYSQGRRGMNMSAEEMAKMRTKRINESLKLDDKQEKSVYNILLDSSKKMREVRSQSSRETMRDKMKKIHEDSNKKLEEVLTKEQLEKYKAHQEERRSSMRGRRGNGNN